MNKYNSKTVVIRNGEEVHFCDCGLEATTNIGLCDCCYLKREKCKLKKMETNNKCKYCGIDIDPTAGVSICGSTSCFMEYMEETKNKSNE